jgi:hypothetical protein
MLAVEIAPGNQHISKHSSPRLWAVAPARATALQVR